MTKSSVLITGASGFLGKYIFDHFTKEGWQVYTLGRNPMPQSYLHINCDLANETPNIPDIFFDKVIHVAGKAHSFPKTQEEKDLFFKVNVDGTRHFISALDKLSVKPSMFIFISSVAVYGKDIGNLIPESSPLDAISAYGISKIQAEELICQWSEKNGSQALNLRLPLIAGINPPGNLGVMKNAIKKGHYLRLKDNFAQKSVVVASDVAQFIFTIQKGSGAYNLTDGIHPTFHDIEVAIEKRLGRKIKITIPFLMVKLMAKVGDMVTVIVGKEMILTSSILTKINSDLTFDDSKARKELGWTSSSALDFVEKYL
jgi:GlcNAc-P-P-Und epimerase